MIIELLFNLTSWAGLILAAYHFGFVLELYLVLIIPLALLALVINPISRGYEHYPLAIMPADDEDRFNISATTITVTNPVLAFMWANITYHVEHHMYPRAPFYQLPKIHKLMQHRDYIRSPYPLYKYSLKSCDSAPKMSGQQY